MAESKINASINRRAFLAGIAASTASLALVGCSPENKLESLPVSGEAKDGVVYGIDAELTSTTGKWRPVRCNWSCGGRCFNQAFIEDGIVLRQKTDDMDGDDIENPQRRACPRGRSQQQLVFGADRLKYPMKRKNWTFEEPHGELRGCDEWERISWDEAIDTVANVLKTTKEKYGNEAITCSSITPHRGISSFINAFGGYLRLQDTASHGMTYAGTAAMGLDNGANGCTDANDRMDMVNAETVVLYGMNPVWASAGNQSYYAYTLAKENGADFVFVGPEYNVSASLFQAKWIRVRPGTDTAFLLAVCYEMFKADAAGENNIDWPFLETYTYGIDADHMAPGVDASEDFKTYLYGAYDGQVKDAQWASEICGCTPEDIVYYAGLMHKDKKTMTYYSYAPSRCLDAPYWINLMHTVAFMGGHMGKSGHCCCSAYHAGAFRQTTAGGSWINLGDDELNYSSMNALNLSIQQLDIADAIAGKEVRIAPNWYLLQPNGEPYTPNIHVYISDGGAGINNTPNINAIIESFRLLDCHIATGWSMTPECTYADIVLPIQTDWEVEGEVGANGAGTSYNDPEAVIFATKTMEPYYESKHQYEMWREVGDRLGMDMSEAYPISLKQSEFNRLKNAYCVNEKGETQPLLNITQEDIDRWGVEATPQSDGAFDLTELEEKGILKIRRTQGDAYTHYQYEDYIKDPEGNPRMTASGRWEIHSQPYADFLNGCGYTEDFTWKPYPVYKPAKNGYEQSLTGEYKFQIFNPHYLRRQHSKSDNLPWMREAFQNPVWMNRSDAEELGIQHGDTVRIYNQQGSVLRRASLVETLMPHCLSLPHGAWVDIDEETGIDRAGSPNVLVSNETSDGGTSGYNTTLVNIEKWTGEPLEEDHNWPQRIVEL